ncbi:MAG TPA: glycosyltransferase family 2 protein [Candidatus Paceibacterota bacterium]|jgi:cellulose synthase/poly-beta-1,6-N-acetylglucosamine synthase-like glycosyltransferase|nr:glycosyltransferase family 2 protein [Candidatus Paceibacterota bacterium]
MYSLREIITLGILFMSLYFEMFMLITYFEHRKSLHKLRTTTAPLHPDLPGVTIIVPCFNEETTAVKTIESLLALEYPREKLHIMAINDGSTDGTALALAKYNNHPQIEIIHKENGGKHTVLNMGIARATTPFVGCLDADSYAKPDALVRIMKQFENPTVMAVVPSLHIYKPDTIIQRMQKTEYLIGVFLRSILAELRALYVTPGPFSIFRKSVFEQIGYYRKAHNTEDMEMALRMQSHGLTIASAHDAVIYTSSPRTPKKLYKQRVRWTSGFLHNLRDYRGMLLNRKYSHLGGFVLPMMVISAGSVLFVVATFGYDLVRAIRDYVVHFQAIGYKMFEWSWPSFNWFYLHTSPLVFAGLVAFGLVIAFIAIGMRLSHGNTAKIFDIACYVCLYSVIAPFWIIRSLANVALSKQAVWR